MDDVAQPSQTLSTENTASMQSRADDAALVRAGVKAIVGLENDVRQPAHD